MEDLITCLWFDGQAREAARFYVDVIGGDYGAEAAQDPGHAGEPLTVEFTLRGQKFVALNGGPHFTFNEATSIQLITEDQAETDRLWDALIADGGQESQCGWLKDRFGFSWQVVPKRLTELMSGSDPEVTARVVAAYMPMSKIIIADLEAAAAG